MQEHDERFGRLVGYVLGELEGPARAAVESELAASEEAREALEGLRGIVEAMRDDDTALPPERAVDLARAAFRAHRSREVRAWLAGAAEVAAQLVFDSRRRPMVAGFRGAGSGQTGQLAFSSEAGELDVRLEAEQDDRWTLWGQLDADEPAGRVALLEEAGAGPDGGSAERPARLVDEAVPDDRGMFKFSARQGTYTLAIGVGDRVLQTPAFDIG
jgi:hypothetical protein